MVLWLAILFMLSVDSSIAITGRTAIPEAPKIISIDCNERFANIKWKTEFGDFDPVTSTHRIEYRTDFSPTLWKQAGLNQSPCENGTCEQQILLNPFFNYIFRVIAISSEGEGPPGYMNETTCMTSSSHPFTNPANVYVGANATDALIISWEPMERESWNGPNFRYLIEYKLASDVNDNWITLYVEDPYQDRVVIRNQPSFREYHVRVRAVNSIGASLVEPFVIAGFSGEAIPSVAPENFQIVGTINATAMEFAWAHVDPETVNGHVRGYKVQTFIHNWWLYGSKFEVHSADANITDKFVLPSANSTVVTNFSPMQSYGARVLVFNSEFDGPPSTPIFFTTSEGVPSVAPEKLIVEMINGTAAKFSWTRVDPGTVNDNLIGYKVQTWIIEGKNHSDAANVSDTFVQASANSTIIANLSPMKSYGAHVRAANSMRNGPPSIPVFFTTPEGVSLEVTNLDVRAMGSTSIMIKWNKSKQLFGRLQGYFIYVKDIHTNSSYETFVPDPVQHYLYDDARPNSTYEVSVRTMTDGGEGPDVSQTVQTFPHGNPGRPDLEVNRLDPFSARVHWNPSIKGMPGSAFYVDYSIEGSKQWSRTKLVNLPIMEIELNNLEPNQTYWIVLVAQDGENTKPSITKRFRTGYYALALSRASVAVQFGLFQLFLSSLLHLYSMIGI